ncbi:MAG: carboxypeptidase regulatory-like domain-containing protein [Thermoplasmatota archaeon]
MSRGWREFKIFFTALLLTTMALFGMMTPTASAERTFPGIQGTVTDDHGAPLSGAGVRIGTMDHSYFNGTWTNETGYYLVNVSSPNVYRMGFVKDGFFEYAFPVNIPENQLYTIDVSLDPMPAESERVEGTLTHHNGAPAVGYRVTLLYEEMSNRHEYMAMTDSSGAFGWDVFPGDFELTVIGDGLPLLTEEVHVELGDGTLTYDLVLPDLPPKDVVIKGYISDGSSFLEGVMVGIMDPTNEIFNVTFSDPSGYFEVGFWAGFHYLICMAQGYEGYFRGLDVKGASTLWVNATLVLEEFTISGTVKGPDGNPVEGISVQYLQRYVFPESNSAKTDGTGHFSIDIAAGDGFLMVVDENPFETGRFDVYFEEYKDVSDDISIDIDLTANDVMTGTMELQFDNWSGFNTKTSMKLPLNNSRAGRAMVDLMMGDGDLVISEGEAELWEEMITGDDSDIAEGPFGNMTENNFTVDGKPFLLKDDSLEFGFHNVTGAVASDSKFELRVSGSYEVIGEVAGGSMHEVSFNFTYSDQTEEMEMHMTAPGGWRHTGTSETSLELSSNVNKVELIGGSDPDPEDEIDFEWITLTFHDDTFTAVMDPVGPVDEGVETNLTLNVTDHLPDNEYEFVWSVDDEQVGTGSSPYLVYAFPDNGSYQLSVMANDSYGRSTGYEMTVDVDNVVPLVTIEIVGGTNRTFLEGDEVELLMNASDVEMDALFLEWGVNGEFGPELNFTEENRTMSKTLIDDGSLSFQVRVTDDDNATDIASVTIVVDNVAPTFVHSIFEEGIEGDQDVVQGENITIKITDLFDPSPEDTIDIDWTIPDDGVDTYLFDEGASLSIMFIEIGSYDITVNVSDEDGGFTLLKLAFEVGENYTFDQDGDGIPKWWEDKHNLSDTNKDDASMDLDSDGLTNLEEFELGTDPRNPDTDGDNVPDNWDGYPIDDSRYDKDSDNDGHYDWDEVQAGTDPFDEEDYPGKKGSSDNTIWLWIVLIVVGLLLAIGVLVIWASRSAGKGMEYEE